MISADDWSSWVVTLPQSSRRTFLRTVDDRTSSRWYWVDLPGPKGLALEIGLPSDITPHEPYPQWVDPAKQSNLVWAATPRHSPLMCTPALFAAQRCPGPWCELLADTSARALEVLAEGEDETVTPEVMAAELRDVYRSFAPQSQWVACAQWHRGWLTGSDTRRRPDVVPLEYSEPPSHRSELVAALHDWSRELPNTPTWSGPEPAWIPTVARLAHIQAVRLSLADGIQTECDALALLLEA